MPRKKPPRGGVLVAIDFSEASERAAVFAAEAATCRDLPLTLLHVVHDPGHAPGYYADTKRKKVLRRLEDAAGARLEEFVADLLEKHPKSKAIANSHTLLVTGLPVKRTLEVVKKTAPMLLVAGSTGRTGLNRLLIGSKAEQLVRLSPVPIVIVK